MQWVISVVGGDRRSRAGFNKTKRTNFQFPTDCNPNGQATAFGALLDVGNPLASTVLAAATYAERTAVLSAEIRGGQPRIVQVETNAEDEC